MPSGYNTRQQNSRSPCDVMKVMCLEEHILLFSEAFVFKHSVILNDHSDHSATCFLFIQQRSPFLSLAETQYYTEWSFLSSVSHVPIDEPSGVQMFTVTYKQQPYNLLTGHTSQEFFFTIDTQKQDS